MAISESMSKEVCNERQTQFKEAAVRIEKDLEDQSLRTTKLEQLDIKMGTILEQLVKDTAANTNKIRDLEMKPGKRYDAMVLSIIQWLIIAILAASKTGLFGK